MNFYYKEKENMKYDKALVVFSGGQDSTTCLFGQKEILKRL